MLKRNGTRHMLRVLMAVVFTCSVLLMSSFAAESGTEVSSANNLENGLKSTDIYSYKPSKVIQGSAAMKNGILTVKGSGSNAWNGEQGYHYVYKAVTGNTEMVVRLTSMDFTKSNAKAGIMMRYTLEGLTPHLSMNVMPSEEHKGELFSKVLQGSPETVFSTNGFNSRAVFSDLGLKKFPVWMRIVREGKRFRSLISADGNNWELIKEVFLDAPESVYYGIFVCSADTTRLCTANFDKIKISENGKEQRGYLTSGKVIYSGDDGLEYEGSWKSEVGMNESTEVGASYSFSFTGNTFRMTIPSKPWSGRANIYLDGKLLKAVDSKYKTENNNNNLFEVFGLENRKHTVKVVKLDASQFYCTDVVYNTLPIDKNALKVKLISSKYVTVNKSPFDNKMSDLPVLSYKDMTYVPASTSFTAALGFSAKYSAGKLELGRIKDFKKPVINNDPVTGLSAYTEYDAKAAQCKIYINGKALDNSKAQYPVLEFRGVYYLPVTGTFASDVLKCSASANKKTLTMEIVYK